MGVEPIRMHASEHLHEVDRNREIWRRHKHPHAHTMLDWAEHDEPDGGLDARHRHEHVARDPYGQLLKIREHMDRPPDVTVIEQRSEKVAQGDLNKAVFLDAAGEVITSGVIQKRVRAELEKVYKAESLHLDRMKAQLDDFCRREGILGYVRPEQFIGKSAPNPEADALDRKAEAWAPIDRDAS